MRTVLTGFVVVAALVVAATTIRQDPIPEVLDPVVPGAQQESGTTLQPRPVVRTPPPTKSTEQVPRRLQLGGINASIVPVDMTGSELVPPDDPQVLGWWGRPLGAEHGVTLLVGHTVSTGGGALDRLGEVDPGTRLTVSGRAYRVTSNRVLTKQQVAEQARVLFDQHGPHRLVLVTCTDYDRATRTYAANVVLTADPA